MIWTLEVKFDRLVLGMVWYLRNSVPYQHHMNNFFTTFTLQKNQAKWPNKFQQNLMFLRTISYDKLYDILWTIQRYFLKINKGGEVSVKRLWCCVGGRHNRVIWYYQLSWYSKIGHRKEFQSWRFELAPFVICSDEWLKLETSAL